MSARSRIPPAIEECFCLPPERSTIMLTGTLGCATTWLTARFVGKFAGEIWREHGEMGVVLVSWLRDQAFWTTEFRRAMGVDLSKNIEAKRIAFVEGLPHSTLSTAVASLDVLENNITNTIASLQCRKVIVILDSPDLPLATGITTSAALNAVLLRIRSGNNVHSTVFCCSADLPLVSQSADQPLQTEHAAFVVQQAHLARLIISVRELETGAARDVSGVLRVTKGGACHDVEAEHVANVDEKEVLYLVGRDGSVKVFERGAEG